MPKGKKGIITVLLLVLFASSAWAEKAPLEFNAFDGQVVGARAIGVGEAFAGLSSDASAPYWNPAGLALMSGNSFTICSYLQRESSAKWEDVIKSDPLRGGKLTYMSFAAPNGALSIRPLSKIATDTHTNINGVETWVNKKVIVNEIMLSTARKYQDNIYTGVSLNYLNSNLSIAQRTKDTSTDITQINVDTGNGWSLDLGLVFVASPYLSFGVSAINAIGYMYWSDYDKNRLPLAFSGGVAMALPQKVTFMYDIKRMYYPDHEDVTTKHIGIEQYLFNMFTLRAGMSGENWNDPDKVAYTFGVGFSENGYILDLAMKRNKIRDSVVPDRFATISIYVVSLSMPFGGN
ncbi:MAG: hypothetical protein PHD29_04335 [bacterium]|nr:hypothetical protein [bacterium]MDD5755992.1 hypothetical protein [bacterium]